MKENINLDDLEQIFRANRVLPSVKDTFVTNFTKIEESIKTANIVLDTNVLLIPYGAGANSLSHIINVFKKLKKEKILFIPAQVAREFIKNRPKQIGDLTQGLSDKISKYLPPDISYPILEGIESYNNIKELIEQSRQLKKQFVNEQSKLIANINSWEWEDPVNREYKNVFTQDTIIEFEINEENKKEITEELKKRYSLSIPPGYKDSTKDDGGIGDFIIWKTILELGKKSKDLIFISGDEKADWQHRSQNSGFLPRYELVDEYRQVSNGKSFHMIPLSRLLELLKVESASVDEIKKEEERIQEANMVTINCPYCESSVTWRLENNIAASAKPKCVNCSKSFHIHRASDSITIRKAYDKSSRQIEVQSEIVSCPKCNNEVEAELGVLNNSTFFCKCSKCEASFPIHRLYDGSVKVSLYK